MEKWLKYFLSFFVLVAISCNDQKNLPQNVIQSKVADSVFNLNKKLYQGSKESQQILKKVIEIDSTYDDALREISVPFLKRGMPHEWKPLYQKAVDADPQTWVPMRGYLYLLFYRDYEKAIADFNASDTLTPHLDYPQGHSVDYWRGIAYSGLKDYSTALEFWNKHIKKETEDTGEDWVELEAFLYRGITHMEMKNYKEAIANFKKIKTLYKSSAEAKYYWAKCLLAKSEKSEALSLLEEAETDYKNKLRLSHNYVEMPYQIYLSDIQEIKSSLLP